MCNTIYHIEILWTRAGACWCELLQPVVRECEFAGALELASVLEMVPMAKALGQLRFLGDIPGGM